MAASDQGGSASLFFTNVLNGTVAGNGNVVHGGTIMRMDLIIASGKMPVIQAMTVIGSGFSEKTDPDALVIGPTGVYLGMQRDGNDGDHHPQVLYIADSINNRIAAIEDPLTRVTSAGIGMTVTSGGSLNDPLGLTVLPDGNIVTANGGDGFAVGTTPSGHQIAKALLDSSGNPPGAGALFGLAFVTGQGLYYVDDATNTLNVAH
jgi:hypothetical protein